MHRHIQRIDEPRARFARTESAGGGQHHRLSPAPSPPPEDRKKGVGDAIPGAMCRKGQKLQKSARSSLSIGNPIFRSSSWNHSLFGCSTIGIFPKSGRSVRSDPAPVFNTCLERRYWSSSQMPAQLSGTSQGCTPSASCQSSALSTKPRDRRLSIIHETLYAPRIPSTIRRRRAPRFQTNPPPANPYDTN